MEKVLFAVLAGICVISSIMSTTVNTGKINSNPRIGQIIRDTIPTRKTDTSRYPKRDTTSMPRIVDLSMR